jgi:Fe2+ transport system protein FeoA
MQPLDALQTSATARIVHINSEFDVRERLLALGLRPGHQVRLIRRLGRHGPLQVRVDHTDVVVRAADAARIEVEIAP